jgi:hypothetical protein
MLRQNLNLEKGVDDLTIVNEGVAVDNLIKNPRDEINEGERIINSIKSMFDSESPILKGIEFQIYNGYVYIKRKGIKMTDIITEELIPDLNHLAHNYNKSIDYQVLKFILFQNEFQKSLSKDQEIKEEASKILSQEYLISFQPQPQYVGWCIRRLIEIWYADLDMQNNIRKMKILINQYKAKDTEEYNQLYGVKPMIVVYPKYGSARTRIVLTRLAEYFTLYVTLGWKISHPDYFIKINDLMYYTNGSTDLKLYFRKTLKSSNASVTNDVFNPKYTELTESANIFYEKED